MTDDLDVAASTPASPTTASPSPHQHPPGLRPETRRPSPLATPPPRAPRLRSVPRIPSSAPPGGAGRGRASRCRSDRPFPRADLPGLPVPVRRGVAPLSPMPGGDHGRHGAPASRDRVWGLAPPGRSRASGPAWAPRGDVACRRLIGPPPATELTRGPHGNAPRLDRAPRLDPAPIRASGSGWARVLGVISSDLEPVIGREPCPPQRGCSRPLPRYVAGQQIHDDSRETAPDGRRPGPIS